MNKLINFKDLILFRNVIKFFKNIMFMREIPSLTLKSIINEDLSLFSYQAVA